MEVLVFIGLAIALVLGLIGFFGRCRACCSWAHAFNPGHAADIPDGKAYIVCKRCGDRLHKGEVSSDGSVVWMSGGSGQFHEDGLTRVTQAPSPMVVATEAAVESKAVSQQ